MMIESQELLAFNARSNYNGVNAVTDSFKVVKL